MLPIGPLMIEHRLIEKMIVVIRKEAEGVAAGKPIHLNFVDLAVDFVRTYADRCHHGKEEDILFRDLAKKDLSAELQRIMQELIAEHKVGRKAVREIVEAKNRYLEGDQSAQTVLLDRMRMLADFYPKHIEKEDRHFFIPCMQYFSVAEKEIMLKEGWAFDQNLIHKVYADKLSEAEKIILG
jgi:hemerythrin-like domain-containing protein